MNWEAIIPFGRGKQCDFNNAFEIYVNNMDKIFPYLDIQ